MRAQARGHSKVCIRSPGHPCPHQGRGTEGTLSLSCPVPPSPPYWFESLCLPVRVSMPLTVQSPAAPAARALGTGQPLEAWAAVSHVQSGHRGRDSRICRVGLGSPRAVQEEKGASPDQRVPRALPCPGGRERPCTKEPGSLSPNQGSQTHTTGLCPDSLVPPGRDSWSKSKEFQSTALKQTGLHPVKWASACPPVGVPFQVAAPQGSGNFPPFQKLKPLPFSTQPCTLFLSVCLHLLISA